MTKPIESLGLMRIQIEDGSPHSVGETLQMVIEFLDEMGRAGNGRTDRYMAMLAGVDMSLVEFAESFNKAGSALVSKLSRQIRPKTFNGIIQIRDSVREGSGSEGIT